MGLMIRKATEKDLIQSYELYIQVRLAEDYKSSSGNTHSLLTKINPYPSKIFVVEEKSIIVTTFSLLIMDNLAHEGATSSIIDAK